MQDVGSKPGRAVSAYFGYMKGVKNQLAMKHIPEVGLVGVLAVASALAMGLVPVESDNAWAAKKSVVPCCSQRRP